CRNLEIEPAPVIGFEKIHSSSGLDVADRFHCSRGRLGCNRSWAAALDHSRRDAYSRSRDARAGADCSVLYFHAALPVSRRRCRLAAGAAIPGDLMLENICAVFIIIALNVYAVSGGADYGGGVWDLFAGGPRAARQRDVIAEAIGPIWEANHVWLVFVIVVLFTAFPPAFALIGMTLHIPVTLLLI